MLVGWDFMPGKDCDEFAPVLFTVKNSAVRANNTSAMPVQTLKNKLAVNVFMVVDFQLK